MVAAGIAVRLVAKLKTGSARRNAKKLGNTFRKVENENDKMNKSFQRSGRLLKGIAKSAVVAGAGILGTILAAARNSPLMVSAFEKLKVAWFQFGLAVSPVMKPLIEGIEKIVRGVTDWVNSKGKLVVWAEYIRDKVIPFLMVIGTWTADAMYWFIEKLILIFKNLYDAIKPVWDILFKVGKWTGGTIVSIINGITTAINKLITAAKGISGKVLSLFGFGGDDGGTPTPDPTPTPTPEPSDPDEVTTSTPTGDKSSTWTRARKVVKATVAKAKTYASSSASWVSKAVSKGVKKASEVVNKVKGAAKSIWGKAKGFFGFQSGGLVQRTGVAMLHQGETVTPRYASGGGGGGTTINITTGPVSSGVDLQNLATLISRELANRNAYGRAV